MASVMDATETEHRGTAPNDDTARTHGPPVLRTGLKQGATAPIFRLPRLEGGEVSLLDYRGRDVLLVFVDPECEACELLWPALTAASAGAPQPSILLISRGEIAPNLEMVARHGLALPVALQRHWEISREYGMFAVPSAFFVDEWGVVAADVAVGQEEVLGLMTRVAASMGSTGSRD
jgi:peroxiredoxin